MNTCTLVCSLLLAAAPWAALAQTTFTKITTGEIVTDGGSSYGCAWGDYDNDGFLDLFVVRYGIDWLYHNNTNGGFTSVTNNLLGTATQGGFNAAWADVNNDGRPDLFVPVYSDQTRRFYLMNLGGGSF